MTTIRSNSPSHLRGMHVFAKRRMLSLLLKAKKVLSAGKKLKQLDEELLALYDAVDGMSHVKENLNEELDYRYRYNTPFSIGTCNVADWTRSR